MRKWMGIKALWVLVIVLLGLTLQTPTEAAQIAYITNSGDSTVSVINTATNTVTATIPVGSSPFGVAVTPDGAKVYVANNLDDTVSLIATATNTVTATIPVGSSPFGVAVTPDGAKVYVANNLDDTVSLIATATNTVTATIPVGSSPVGVAVTPDGAKVYVANNSDSTVSVIDTATNTVTATIPVGSFPFGVAVTPDGTKVYVANVFDDTVSLIATATNTVTATITVGSRPGGVAVTPDGAKVYVANFSDDTVSVINTATNAVTDTIQVGSRPFGVAVTPDGTKVYVANRLDSTVSVIDTATNTVTCPITVGSSPIALGQFIANVPTFRGSVDGLTPVKVICRNLNAGQTVIIEDGSTSFDCAAAGLSGNQGDRVEIIIEGLLDNDIPGIPGIIEAGEPFYVSREGQEAWETVGRIVGLAEGPTDFTVTALTPSGEVVMTVESEYLEEGLRAYEAWLEPATYSLRITAEGYEPLELHGLEVKAEYDLRIDLIFRP